MAQKGRQVAVRSLIAASLWRDGDLGIVGRDGLESDPEGVKQAHGGAEINRAQIEAQ